MLLAYATTHPMQFMVDRMSIARIQFQPHQYAIGPCPAPSREQVAWPGSRAAQQVASRTEQLLQIKNGGPALLPVGLPRAKATTD